jgi:drug/metabolite transporter (DMT)-like permease
MIPLRRLVVLVVLAMIAFAANSLLCRLALRNGTIDAASFTTIRIVSGAVVLWVIARMRDGTMTSAGSWGSGAALFAYAAAFSFAYVELSAAVGALILFCAVQVTMIGWGLWSGERIGAKQAAGLSLAIGGLVGLLWPGLSAPPPGSAALMLAAGIAWGIYSLRGKRSGDPTIATAGNFMRAAPFAVILSLATLGGASIDTAGVLYAMASGALASGLGYAIWYTALPGLTATKAATIQLSVPVIAAAAAVVLLDESITLRLVLSSAAILGGIGLVVGARFREQAR